MDFIEAVIRISRLEDFTICADPEERAGWQTVCVHDGPVPVGKLRWPWGAHPARVDDELVAAIELAEREPSWEKRFPTERVQS